MSINHKPYDQPKSLQRRQVLATAAALGIAPWLLTAFAGQASAASDEAGKPTTRQTTLGAAT